MSLLSPLGEGRGPSFEQAWIPSIQGCSVLCSVEIGPVVLEKNMFKYFQYNFIFSLLSFLGKGRGPSFEQTSIPLPKDAFLPSLVQIGQTVLEKKIFKYFQYNFTILPLCPLGERLGPSFKQTWISFTQGCFVPWPSGSGEEVFLIQQFLFTFLQLSPLGKGRDPSFEQIWILSIQVLSQVWLKLVQWFWRRRF